MSSDPKAMVQKLWDYCDTQILVGGRGAGNGCGTVT